MTVTPPPNLPYSTSDQDLSLTGQINQPRPVDNGLINDPPQALSSVSQSDMARHTAIRIFFTCWIIYSLHFATNVVREIYPALAIGDHLSFRVDEYAHMHVDIFNKKGYGWHIGNNPGVSMLAAIPYAIARPIIDPIVRYTQATRTKRGDLEPPSYNSPWPMNRQLYAKAWQRGLDIKFGLAAFVMQSLCMAPSSALAVVVMFYLFIFLFKSHRTALWLSLLYAFGTPVFFRTGHLNHNLMLGHIVFIGFVTMWNPSGYPRWSTPTRFFLGGLAGGTALLFDYSGVVMLLGLFCYGITRQVCDGPIRYVVRLATIYVLGTLPPIFLLWFYQWRSFGHPFLPGQNWMPEVEWIERGYQGYEFPQMELFNLLGFDHHFGIFPSSPILILALVCPFIIRRRPTTLPQLEMFFVLILFLAWWIFFSGSNYTRLQANTGIRYMSSIIPFLFLPAAVVLTRLPRILIYVLVIFSITQAWSLAMYRDVEGNLGVLDPILQVFLGGFSLPSLTTLARIDNYARFFEFGPSPLPFFCLAAALIYTIWFAPIRTMTMSMRKKIQRTNI